MIRVCRAPLWRQLRLAVVAAALNILGCATLVMSPPPSDVNVIAVFPIDDRTGSELFADAPPLLSVFRDTPDRRITVPDLLAAEFRHQLAARGFRIVEPAPPGEPAIAAVRSAREAAQRLDALGIEATALFVQLWRWDPDEPSHLTYVDVKLDAFLAAKETGRVVWEARLPAQPVDADGASSVSLGYPEVVRRVVATIIANLAPATNRNGSPR